MCLSASFNATTSDITTLIVTSPNVIFQEAVYSDYSTISLSLRRRVL
jgi:hypothetical protein